jgi:RNA polymerase sigma-70 factor (ECF subfamily)
MDPALPVDALLEHATFLRRLAAALVADPGTADDLVQETWLAAVRTPPREGAPSRGWLGTVLRNAARKLRRGATRRARRERVAARPEGTRSAADQAAKDEVVRAVGEAVFRLDSAQRSVVLMRFYEGLPPRTIAERQGIPVNTVRTRLRLALARLREDLDGRGGRGSDWRPALVGALGLETPPAPWAAAGAAAGVLMGTKAKATVAAGLALLLGGGGAVLLADRAHERDGAPRDDGPAGATTSPAEAPTLAGVARGDPAAPADTPLVEAPPTPSSPASITQRALEAMGLLADTPPDALEGMALDGRTPIDAGTGLLWPHTGGSGPEGLPTNAEPFATRLVSRDGTFRFDGLEPRRWYLGLDLGDGVRRLALPHRDTGKARNPRTFVLLGDGALHGTLLDADGRPAAGVRVRAEVRWEWGDQLAETRTDGAGRYEIGRLPAGSGSVLVAYGGDFDDPRQRVAKGLVVPAGGRAQVDFGRPEGTPRLVGTLRGPDGDPVVGEWRLILFTGDRAAGFFEVPLRPDGTYDQRVPAATYRVSVWHAASVLTSSHEGPTTLDAPLVVAADGRARDVVLPGARVVGSVRTRAGGPAQTTVALRREGQKSGRVASRETGRDGGFRFHGVLPGRYELLLDASDPLPVVVAEGDVEVRRDLTTAR